MSSASVPLGTSSARVATFDPASLLQKVGRDDLLLWASLRENGAVVSRTLVLFAKPKALRLGDPGLRTKVTKAKDGYAVTLTAAKPALWTWIEADDTPLSDNFLHVRPGEPRTILIRAQAPPKVEVHSLFDTYDPRVPLPDLTVHPDPDGTIRADATHAEILGGQVLERGDPPNIGNWSRAKDRLEWRVAGANPGRYRIEIDLASPDGGSRFAIAVVGRGVSGVVPRTGSWTAYTTLDHGTVELSESAFQISLRALNKRGLHVMNLRQITLRAI